MPLAADYRTFDVRKDKVKLNQKSGIIEDVPNRTEGLRRLRKQLTDAPEKDPYVALGRWVLSDTATRTISPYADLLRQTEKSTR